MRGLQWMPSSQHDMLNAIQFYFKQQRDWASVRTIRGCSIWEPEHPKSEMSTSTFLPCIFNACNKTCLSTAGWVFVTEETNPLEAAWWRTKQRSFVADCSWSLASITLMLARDQEWWEMLSAPRMMFVSLKHAGFMFNSFQLNLKKKKQHTGNLYLVNYHE